MNKKLLVQAILLFLIMIISLAFYMEYFNTQPEANLKKQIIVPKIDKNQENQIEDLQYFSKDMEGNTYQINAKTGLADNKNPELIYLNGLNAKINFDINKEIIVTSDKAIYNNITYDTEFIENVVIIHNKHKLNCNNMTALFSKDIVTLSNNVIYDNGLTKLFADQIEYNLSKRVSKISMFDKNKKILINHKNNGTN